MKTRFRAVAALVAALALSLAIAACGSSGDNTSDGSSPAFSVKSIGGNDLLVDASGKALYTNDQDTATKIACTGECTSIWVPLTSGGKPVISNGKPLYSFAEDSPGKVTGDGATDNFGGTTFTWSAATPGGGSESEGPASGSTTDSSSGSSSYGY
jgi:predicted lipoprotein with Yx(FWY)xxD motif